MRTLQVISFLVFSATVSSAQDSVPYDNNKGLLLTYDGSSFLGMGARLWLSDIVALNAVTYIRFHSSGTEGFDNRSKQNVLGGELQFQYSVLTLDESIFYLSLGGAIEGGKYSSVFTLAGGAGGSSSDSYTQYQGLLGGGVEYFISKRLSIGGQHLIKYSIHESKRVDHDGIHTKVTTKEFVFGSSVVLLTFYF